MYLGFKIALTPQEGILPELAVTPQMLLPTGSPPFSSRGVPTPGTDEIASSHVAPGINWLYSWDLNEQWNLGGSTQFNRFDDDVTKQIYTEFAQSVVLHWAITEELDVYSEWYALLPIGADTVPPEQYLAGGIIFYLTKDLQIDARGGVGLNDAADNYFVGAGGAVRF